AEDREVEGLLRAVMVVAGGQVDLGARGDVADLGAVEAALGEEGGGGGEQAVLGGAGAGRGREQMFKTSGRPRQAGTVRFDTVSAPPVDRAGAQHAQGAQRATRTSRVERPGGCCATAHAACRQPMQSPEPRAQGPPWYTRCSTTRRWTR